MEQVDLTVMCMVYDNRGNVLVQDRIKNWTGIAFPGGHVEKGEPLTAAAIREIQEETGLIITNLQLVGIKNYFDFDENYRYMVYLYKTNQYSGTLLSECPEGKNFWLPITSLKHSKLPSTFDVTLDNIYFGDKCEVFYSNEKKDWLKEIF